MIPENLPESHRNALRWFAERAGTLQRWPEPLPDGTRLVTRAQGIYKPAGSEYALSIRQTPAGPDQGQGLEVAADRMWKLLYSEEAGGKEASRIYSNAALIACMRDGVPVGVLRQAQGKPDVRYEVLGLARVVSYDHGRFSIEGLAPLPPTAAEPPAGPPAAQPRRPSSPPRRSPQPPTPPATPPIPARTPGTTLREELVIALAEQLLGPRNGPRETLPSETNPRDEYLVGVLTPRHASVTRDVDAETPDPVAGGDTGEEDDADDSAPPSATSVSIAPALDPRSLPSSLGVSAVLGSPSGAPSIKICATWARYAPNANDEWERRPQHFLHEVADALQPATIDAGDGVRLVLRPISLPSGDVRLSIYLVNDAAAPAGVKARPQDHVFQPEIRVVLNAGTTLVPFERRGPEEGDGEERSLELLYRDRRAYARGHLCSAVWKAVDPQLPPEGREPILRAGFAWIDGAALPEEVRRAFERADFRTEYLPTYNIATPSFAWRDADGPAPELRAAALAETFEPTVLEQALRPLENAYSAWIETQREHAGDVPEQYRDVASRHIAAAEASRDRLRRGIELLRADENARLSFCFMNKAMETQSQWTRQRALDWRPFQLAFILQSLDGIARPESPDRDVCDLLWFATGGGKTEAYLGLAIFTLALRRRRGLREGHGGGGVGVISRYTLRLLTIQQFRRALAAITAADYLRVVGLESGRDIGWRPKGYRGKETHPWGVPRFSVGLWVGQSVTPNRLESLDFPDENGRMIHIPGALEILQTGRGEGEPAQIISCPACAHDLAIPEKGIPADTRVRIDLLVRPSQSNVRLNPAALSTVPFAVVNQVTVSRPLTSGCLVVSIDFTARHAVTTTEIDPWITGALRPLLGVDSELVAIRPSRAGYFVRRFRNQQRNERDYDYEIVCANPSCPLRAVRWFEMVPLPTHTTAVEGRTRMDFQEVMEPFKSTLPHLMEGMPISAYCVDEQVYHRCPSMIIATADKFARLAFEPKAGNLFGNVDRYHSRFGYYRLRVPPTYRPSTMPQDHPPGFSAGARLHTIVPPFDAPDLIIQDELHLIEGPLGSLVGLYEAAIDTLCARRMNDSIVRAKYVASTATIRQASTQVRAIYDRELAQFPAPGLTIDDSFYTRTREVHVRDESVPGRLYLGFAAPGRGGQTPIVRVWSTLLQRVHELQRAGGPANQLDNFWTLVGYFNAIRELAGVAGLARQDIPQRMDAQSGGQARQFGQPLELSSRGNSQELPSMLQKLAVELPGPAVDAVLATSMFGTGVDIDRLGLMVVHGQPKTTSAYIQSTGRVGRRRPGLIVDFLRAGRPRDLDHYEFFVGYHRALHRSVEAVTVAPFSPRARERALGPLAVVLLRNAREINGVRVSPEWGPEQRGVSGVMFSQATRMQLSRTDPEVRAIVALLERRSQVQPDGRRPPIGATEAEAESELDRWRALASLATNPDDLVYQEPGMVRAPRRMVVLGDALHVALNLEVAYENAPQSLRDVESTTRFEG